MRIITKDLADFLYSTDKSAETQSTGTETSQTSQDLDNNDAVNPAESENGIVSAIPDGEKYVAPEESAITEPENVAGRNGYQPIVEDAKEIAEIDGEKLAETIGYGETGEGLEFDTRFNPYYGMLDRTLQSVYRQIYANAVALNPTFAPIEDVSMNQLKNAFTAVFGDHSELFWLDTTYTCKYMPSGKLFHWTMDITMLIQRGMIRIRIPMIILISQIVTLAQIICEKICRYIFQHMKLIWMKVIRMDMHIK